MRLADFDTQDHNVFRALHVRANLVAITQLNILSIRTHWPSLYIDFVRAVDIHLAIAYCQCTFLPFPLQDMNLSCFRTSYLHRRFDPQVCHMGSDEA